MITSEQINEIAGALAKAQAEIQNPAKDAENPHFRSRYADMASGLNAVRPALSKHGIAVVQCTGMDGEVMVLDTRLIHSSGQWIGSTYPVCRFPAKQQEAGSALTYARRYALFALVGITGEDDDDGNEASKAQTPAPQRREPPPKTTFVSRAAQDTQPPKNDGEPLSKDESNRVSAVLLGTLSMCGSVESLRQWAIANKPTKDRLTEEDQQRVSLAYTTALNSAKREEEDGGNQQAAE